MKTLLLTMRIPVVPCAACTKQDDSAATPIGTTVEATPNPPATSNTTAAGDAAATAPVTSREDPPTAQARFVSAAGHSANRDLAVTDLGDAVAIRGVLTGHAPGSVHGFHVHESGNCMPPDFTSAGSRYNPTPGPWQVASQPGWKHGHFRRPKVRLAHAITEE